ncbi:predicted protein [Aspergillus nidulans FGSC A4]|uniref:Uncharacterized protein n=1 Tax=Emericella nidulans (strain FGSC A4 / ATCC 38163 / CBS 112.46 / NRRL 194 / M139) TaxID=227321 RepID=Q5AY24_EMENI|nr:hypothetical protein [Aspergillus nidulans FGSC A4]EAA58205.1 predicted protein [Aspergillus nidulans FGSC A4]CBF71499.1 TPA: conserved hypothetical protein [Aspergillus nidulans FGSC A4]|eukprot:XP_664410.1 predicted protein [Aspergillus nidulans FGSC A4]
MTSVPPPSKKIRRFHHKSRPVLLSQVYARPGALLPLPCLPRLQSIWREALPELAGSFAFISHGLLSVAYIHMASLSPETSRSLLGESAFHVDQALPQYLEVIKNINKDNTAALFGFAMFINVITVESVSEECGALLRVARNVPSKRPETIKRLATHAVRVIHGQQGIFSIFSRFQRWTSNILLYPAIERRGAPVLREPTTSWVSVEDGRLARLSLLWERNPAVPATESQALCAALNSLRAAFVVVTQLTVPALAQAGHEDPCQIEPAAVELEEIHRRLSAVRLDDVLNVFTWLILIPRDFDRMIKEGNMYAMVMLAYYAILLDRTRSGLWWIHQLPHRYVLMAELVLGKERRE